MGQAYIADLPIDRRDYLTFTLLMPGVSESNVIADGRDLLTEKGTLQFMIEGFNIANRANYSRVNDVVGASFALPFNVQGNASLQPNQPLAFTSDFQNGRSSSVQGSPSKHDAT